MANKERTSGDATARAEELVAAVELGSPVSTSDHDTVVEALTADLHAASDLAAVAEERLVKIEAQTRVLAEAVIAMTDTADAVRPAVAAVKAEMSPPAGHS